jgi:molybdopterin-guanine dinucleotide biosynthesis protein A
MWSAAILAGGRSRRFGGRDKSSLVVEGRTILERQLAEIITLTDDVLVVGGPERKLPAPARLVSDRVPGCGPLGGLHTALTEMTGKAVIVVACDIPYVQAKLLRHLLTLTRDADVVVPFTERGYHPLCAAYTSACLEPVTARLADGRLKMTGLFEDVRVRAVTSDELNALGGSEEWLANVNTPAEYGGLETLQRHEL